MANEGADLTKTKKAIAAAFKNVVAMKEERKAINDEISSLRQDLVAKGIPKAAFDMALKYANWDEDKRKGFDAAYALAREAIGVPFNPQGDLFIPDESDESDEDRRNAAAQAPMFQQ